MLTNISVHFRRSEEPESGSLKIFLIQTKIVKPHKNEIPSNCLCYFGWRSSLARWNKGRSNCTCKCNYNSLHPIITLENYV